MNSPLKKCPRLFVLATPPSERVQFILGKDDDDDDEHRVHDIFCEMSELVCNESDNPEDWQWKECAR